MDKLVSLLTLGKQERTFAEVHSIFLVLLGALSFIVAGYWGLALSTVILDLIEKTNKYGLPPLAVGLWFLVGIYAAITWCFGCIASRCHAVLYEKWFK
ncbi:hypothetical protein K8B33_03970 [Alcanivorax sp. JB21]|uniref:hypothetical protein n=1 Tax=Alcanivorax limicola TaxID=2874102 RepID=UPI001CBEAB32|nr:hypothetical protein [Alcanivorax limicola]MBZ2188238.1 hypothetical protein [Alcanivorax limicola]